MSQHAACNDAKVEGAPEALGDLAKVSDELKDAELALLRHFRDSAPFAAIRRLLEVAWDREQFRDADADLLGEVERWLAEHAPKAADKAAQLQDATAEQGPVKESAP